LSQRLGLCKANSDLSVDRTLSSAFYSLILYGVSLKRNRINSRIGM